MLMLMFRSEPGFKEFRVISPKFLSINQYRLCNHYTCPLINALVFCKLFYCSNVWSNTSQVNLDKLQSVQNFACRIVTGSRKYDHITPQLKKLGWLSVRQQLYFRFATLALKCMNGYAPEYLSSKFVKRSEISLRSTRNSQLLNIPFYHTANGQRSFEYRVVSFWNELDSKLKLSKSITDFKGLRRKAILSNRVAFFK